MRLRVAVAEYRLFRSCAGRRPANARRPPRRDRSTKPNHGTGFVRHPVQSDAAHLDQTGQYLGRARQQAAAGGFEMDAIVGDQPREPQGSGARGFKEFERKPGFSGSGRSADQHRVRANQHGRGVHRRQRSRHHIAGRRTIKRAPVTVGVPSASGGPIRFSTQMAPPCASTICLEIERPRPEFWPNP